MEKRKLSKEEFEEQYSKNSNMTISELNKSGLFAEECNCGDSMCSGWKMTSNRKIPIEKKK